MGNCAKPTSNLYVNLPAQNAIELEIPTLRAFWSWKEAEDVFFDAKKCYTFDEMN